MTSFETPFPNKQYFRSEVISLHLAKSPFKFVCKNTKIGHLLHHLIIKNTAKPTLAHDFITQNKLQLILL